jgi:hypothetical protein
MMRETHKSDLMAPELDPIMEILSCEDCTQMRSRYSQEFLQRFAMAFYNYEAGEWGVAKEMFSKMKGYLPAHHEEEDLVSKGEIFMRVKAGRGLRK